MIQQLFDTTMDFDIDEELAMLTRQLMEVQEQKTNPLSERTIAQIMIKLHQQGFKFYATTDGNQYVTPQKIDSQIAQFVNERGRTKIGILPQILNLNQDLIESRINSICQKSGHIRNNDILVSKQYLKQFIHSLKQRLESDGIVELDEVALSQQFNMPFLMKIISESIQTLDAQIAGNQLVTKQYRRMKKKRILGFLLAISRPVNIDTILKVVKLNDPNSQNLIQQLIQQGKLKGRCQNSFYIPDKFSENQKEMARKFYQNNGYIDFNMLQKNFQVSKPEDWIKKNLKGGYVIFEGTCFDQSKLQSFKHQVQSLLKGQGFFQISNVIPFQMDDQKMQKFFNEICGVKQVIINQGLCYSQQWLKKCTNQFRDKVIFDIFFKKSQPKGKKKGGKKDKQITFTENQVVQTLFDAGLAEYSVAENIAAALIPLLSERMNSLKAQLESQLNKTKGIISNAFLKYKKCKTILKSHQNLQRVLNTIEKQKKKAGGQLWVDPDFGPNQQSNQGKFSLIYYDGICPQQWMNLENLRWQQVPTKILFNSQGKSRFMAKSQLINLLELIQFHNSKSNARVIPTPNFNKYLPKSESVQQLTSPFCFRFFISEKETRYVLIDNRMPFIHEEPFCTPGLNGLIEKAYAKLRYCYKALLGLGIYQTILQITGIIPNKISIENENDQERVLKELDEGRLATRGCLLIVAEGVPGKKIKRDGEQIELYCMRPYLVIQRNKEKTEFELIPSELKMTGVELVKLFKNMYLIQN